MGQGLPWDALRVTQPRVVLLFHTLYNYLSPTTLHQGTRSVMRSVDVPVGQPENRHPIDVNFTYSMQVWYGMVWVIVRAFNISMFAFEEIFNSVNFKNAAFITDPERIRPLTTRHASNDPLLHSTFII